MKHLGIEIDVRNLPELDQEFLPLYKFNTAFLKTAKKSVSVAVERAGGQMATYHTFIHGTPEMAEADRYYIDRLIKTVLWMKGGFKIYISGDDGICEQMKQAYAPGGSRAFDADFMANVYERPFEVVACGQAPEEKSESKPVGRHLEGCRIGFDAGGSDRKVSAVIDGEPVFSEEVVWFPKTNSDPDYHFEGIVSAMKAAAEHMPRVDAIGVSSAGIYIDNRTMNASLFLKEPKDLFDAKVKDIYIRAAKEIGDVPVTVCNDGDVTALAGAMSLNENNVLGIAMGTSEAVGYVDQDGNITGWLNELAFMPVDASPKAMEDEWSGDIASHPQKSSKRCRRSWRKRAALPKASIARSAYTSAIRWHTTIICTAASMCCCSGGSCPGGAGISSWRPPTGCSRTNTPKLPRRSKPRCRMRRHAG